MAADLPRFKGHWKEGQMGFPTSFGMGLHFSWKQKWLNGYQTVFFPVTEWSTDTKTGYDDLEVYMEYGYVFVSSTGRNDVKIAAFSFKVFFIVRRAGLLWSQQDFEWRWSVPLCKCLTVLEFSFILFDLCLLITFFNFIMNYVPIVTFWIFNYHKIWILSIMFCFIWSYLIIYFLACLEVSWRVVS